MVQKHVRFMGFPWDFHGSTKESALALLRSEKYLVTSGKMTQEIWRKSSVKHPSKPGMNGLSAVNHLLWGCFIDWTLWFQQFIKCQPIRFYSLKWGWFINCQKTRIWSLWYSNDVLLKKTRRRFGMPYASSFAKNGNLFSLSSRKGRLCLICLGFNQECGWVAWFGLKTTTYPPGNGYLPGWKLLSHWFSHLNLWFSSQPCESKPIFPGWITMILLVQSTCLWFFYLLHHENMLLFQSTLFFYRLNNHVSKLN